MALNISRIIALSTGHLTGDTMNRLENTPYDSSTYPVAGGPIPYGFFVYAHDDQGEGPDAVPDDVWTCCEFARAQGCDYIRFDCDVDMIPDLPDHSSTHGVAGGPAAAAAPDAHPSPAIGAVAFVGEAWVNDHAVAVDEGSVLFLVTADDIRAAGYDPELPDLWSLRSADLDGLKDVPSAPDLVRNWPGPFTITLSRLDDEDAEACSDCGAPLDEAGDGYDGRCPSCADRVADTA